jgi:predicted phage-related endonuclease
MSRYLLTECEQQSPEWWLARLGRLTGSNASIVLVKKADSVQRGNLRFQLALERINGTPQAEGFSNAHTDRGNQLEPAARAEYEAARGRFVEQAGFAYLESMMVGCSVDGFVHEGEAEGLIEIKCPIPRIHDGYSRLASAPADHMAQINHNLWVTGAAFCDFISYCPLMPGKLALHVCRVPRDEKAIRAYEVEALVFLAEVAELETDMRRRAA